MKRAFASLLCCPSCKGPLELRATDTPTPSASDEILTGCLLCPSCSQQWPILGGIPRFVPADNYAASFGLEWERHAQTQYDSYTGLPLSADRFFGETLWARRLPGETILEAGSGGGRFTEQAASTGALVVSLDYSSAVDANYRFNGARGNVLIVQADIYAMPVRPDSFDKVVCLGVLQHTPDPERAMGSLVACAKPGGSVVFDVYLQRLATKLLNTKYYVRPLTRRIKPERLYALTTAWVNLLWPLAGCIRRIPRLGPAINWRLLVADYSGFGLTGNVLKEWAYLDTFDMLSPYYDSPQTMDTVGQWCLNAGLSPFAVERGGTGLVARGRKYQGVDA